MQPTTAAAVQLRSRQRERAFQQLEARPCKPRSLASSNERLSQDPGGPIQQPPDLLRVRAHGEVVVVPLQSSLEPEVLLAHRVVSMLSTPRRDRRERPRQPTCLCLHVHVPPSISSAPVPGETEKIEGRWPSSIIVVTRTAKWNQPSFLGAQSQSVPLETLRECPQHSIGVLLVREDNHEVVRIPDQLRRSSHTRHHVALEPFIERVVKVDVTQERRQRGPLRRSDVRSRERISIEDSHVQTLPDEP